MLLKISTPSVRAALLQRTPVIPQIYYSVLYHLTQQAHRLTKLKDMIGLVCK